MILSSYQMTSFLYLCVSSIWLVHGKPNPTTPLSPHLPERRIDLGGVEGVSRNEIVPSGQPFKMDRLLHSPLFVQNQISKGNEMEQDDVIRKKRTPSGFTARGFHENIFDRDFGHFSPVKRILKRRPEADASGFYGDTFSNGFGEFETMKRDGSYLNDDDLRPVLKRTEMGANGFDSDTFTQGFGNFDTMKKRLIKMLESGVMKRKPEMTKSGFHSDVFNSGFGEFHPM